MNRMTCPVRTQGFSLLFLLRRGARFCACATFAVSPLLFENEKVTRTLHNSFERHKLTSHHSISEVCPPGQESKGGTQCVPCPLNTFKSTTDINRCAQCPAAGSGEEKVTRDVGATSAEECIRESSFRACLAVRRIAEVNCVERTCLISVMFVCARALALAVCVVVVRLSFQMSRLFGSALNP